MTAPNVHLRPEPPGDDPSVISWRVGPGLVRTIGDVPSEHAPDAIRRLLADGMLESVTVAPGRIRTRLASGHTAADAGATIRSALFDVLSVPGGWPDGPADQTSPAAAQAAVAVAADRELSAAVAQVLAGDFGAYTSSHGGAVTLLDVRGGQVRVQLAGRCNGCAFADNTIRNDLVARLAGLPGFRGVTVAGDRDCSTTDTDRGRRRVSLALRPFDGVRKRRLNRNDPPRNDRPEAGD